jgi:hypothetical protein
VGLDGEHAKELLEDLFPQPSGCVWDQYGDRGWHGPHLTATIQGVSAWNFPQAAPPPPTMPEPKGLRHTQTKEEELIQLLTTIEHGRQALVDALQARTPVYVEEFGVLQNSGVRVVAAAQTRNLERISYVLAIIPAGQTGTLVLGNVTIPLPAGVTQLMNCCLLLEPSEVRSLTSTSGAPTLLLTGEQVPLYGKIN